MKLPATSFLLIGGLFFSACSGARSEGSADKVVKSAKAGDITITLSSRTGELRNGDNELTLSFADQSGSLVDIGAASLKFHMPAMGSMPAMDDVATLTTTRTTGKYHARVNIEMAGTWEAVVVYQGPQGNGTASMTVIVK